MRWPSRHTERTTGAFSTTRTRGAADPFFLYAASNLGSLAALLAYPFAIEPLLGLDVLTEL